jgi:thiamine kinase-like enzyme
MDIQRNLVVQNSSATSVAGSEVTTTQQQIRESIEASTTLTEQQELQQLSLIIKTWRELGKEVDTLNQQVREKKKRMKALDEMILRIMKKHNIGALDLRNSGGRILYKRASSKEGLTPKNLFSLLTTHMKSETAAADAIKYITEHRGSKVTEKILYEKE